MAKPILSLKIKKMIYPGSGLPLIENFNLKVNKGEIIALLGPSGIGKTTLLRIIAGLEGKYSGTVTFAGRIIDRPRKEIQFVFQDYRLLPWKDVGANIEFTRSWQEPVSEVKLNHWLSVMGLGSRVRAWPKQLSGGQKSRVALARAFYALPRLLLLDEPCQNLDVKTKYPILKKLRQTLKARKTTCLVVSHVIEDAILLADTIYLLDGYPLRPVHRWAIHKGKLGLAQTRVAELTEEITAKMLH